MKKSLRTKVLIYLSILVFIILGGILFLQILSLGKYYEWMKGYQIKNVASKVISEYKENGTTKLDNLSYENDICVEIYKEDEFSYSTESISRGCIINDKEIEEAKKSFIDGNKKSITYKIINPRFNNKVLIYGVKVDDNTYVFISTSLEPINSTVSVLKSQLIYIVIIVLIISVLIAFEISTKISKPIKKLTETSKEMARGNYDIKYEATTDITEINELADTLNKATKELAKTETLRRELLANVSHDLKTPLTLIKGNAEMVRDLTYKNKEKREKSLNTIVEEVDRLNLLVEDILNLSKIQAKSEDLNITEININETIKSIIKRFDILCEKDKYKINYEGFDYKVKADKKKIEQVIYNLINNAINYTGEDKQVYIKMKNEKKYIRIEVKDTGKGIKDEDLDHIWDKYYKVDKKYKRVTYGTGLGLSIVKNVLILHNFNYGVDSKAGSGTTFYFDIKKDGKQYHNNLNSNH